MKVVAISKEGYLLEATEKEIINLIGYFKPLPTISKDTPIVKIGDNINVNNLYHQINNLGITEKELKRVAEKLRECADLLTTVEGISKNIRGIDNKDKVEDKITETPIVPIAPKMPINLSKR